MSKDKQINEFLNLLPKLKTEEFIGVCRLLKVKLMNEDTNEHKPFEDVVVELLQAFNKQNRRWRRDVMKILKAATKGE